MPSRRRSFAVAVLLALSSAACTGGDQAGPSPSPSATVVPTSPGGGGGAVAGERIVEIKSVANGPAVFNAGDPNAVDPPADDQAVTAFAEAVATWLDGHLASLQAGDGGRLDEVAAPGLVEGSAPEVLAAVTTELASPDRPVAGARYRFLVAHTGAPVWLHVTTDVTAADGSAAFAQFVFTPGERPILLAAGEFAPPAPPENGG